MSDSRLTVNDFIKNFPYPAMRERQPYVLNEISTTFASGYKYIVLEAPTGFGKSPVGIAVARTWYKLYMYFNQGFTDPVRKGFSISKNSERKEQFHLCSKRRFYKKWHLQMWVVHFKQRKRMLPYNCRLWAMYE